MLGGDVIRDQHARRLNVAFQTLTGDLKVHHVTRVVLHDVQHTSTLIRPPRSLRDLHRVGARKQQARAHRVQHALSHKAGVHGLVARAATGDHGHRWLAICSGDGAALAQKTLFVPFGIRVVRNQTAEGFSEKVGGVIGE